MLLTHPTANAALGTAGANLSMPCDAGQTHSDLVR
jgi:hypothetical protein